MTSTEYPVIQLLVTDVGIKKMGNIHTHTHTHIMHLSCSMLTYIDTPCIDTSTIQALRHQNEFQQSWALSILQSCL